MYTKVEVIKHKNKNICDQDKPLCQHVRTYIHYSQLPFVIFLI